MRGKSALTPVRIAARVPTSSHVEQIKEEGILTISGFIPLTKSGYGHFLKALMLVVIDR